MKKNGVIKYEKIERIFAVFFACSIIALVNADYSSPPKMTVGVVDWRYPDYIVKPLPPCPFEGVFTHPRNCSWYYRCHKIENIQFFRRFYFQCVTGAVFSDYHDQCLLPKDVNDPCKYAYQPGFQSPSEQSTRPSVTQSPATVSLTTKTTSTLSFFPSPTTPTSTPKVSTPPPKVSTTPKTCSTSYSKCKIYSFCTMYNERGTRYLCSSSFSECQGDGFKTRLCLANHLYDPTRNECITRLCPLEVISTGYYPVTSESSGGYLSGIPSTPTIDVVDITTKPPTATITVSCISHYSQCRNYDICYKDQSTEKRSLCLQAYSECSNNSQKKILCSTGNLYDPVKNKCVQQLCPLVLVSLLIHEGSSGSTSEETSSGTVSIISESGATGVSISEGSSSSSGSGTAINNVSGSQISTSSGSEVVVSEISSSSSTSSSNTTGSGSTSETSTQSKHCFYSYSQCRTYAFCTANRERGTRYLCVSSFVECQGDGFRKILCLLGHLYDPKRNECITNLCPLRTTSTVHHSITLEGSDGHISVSSGSSSSESASGSTSTSTVEIVESSSGSVIESGSTQVSGSTIVTGSNITSTSGSSSSNSTSTLVGSHVTEMTSISGEGVSEGDRKPIPDSIIVNCFSYYSECRNYDICYKDQPTEKRSLCLRAYSECSNNSQKKILCSTGNLYDPLKNKCVQQLCPFVLVSLLIHEGSSGSTSEESSSGTGSTISESGAMGVSVSEGSSSSSGSETAIDSVSGSQISTSSESEVIVSEISSSSSTSSSSTTGSVSTSEINTLSKECFSSYSQCRTYAFCTANRERGTRYLCVSSYSECQGDGFRTRLCLLGHLYDPSRNECITNLCPLQITSIGHHNITLEGSDGHVSVSSGSSSSESASGSTSTSTVEIVESSSGSVIESGSTIVTGSNTISSSGSSSSNSTSTSLGSHVTGTAPLPNKEISGGDTKPSHVTVTCVLHYSQCRNYDICHEDQLNEKRYLCLQSYSKCSNSLHKYILCAAANLYDPVKNKCVQQLCPLVLVSLLTQEESSGSISASGPTGDSASGGSSSTPSGSGVIIDNASGSHISISSGAEVISSSITSSSGTSSSSNTGSVSTSETSIQSKECFSSYSQCRTYEFCTSNNERGTRYLCTSAFTECQGDGFRTRLCLVSHLYDPSRNECIKNLCPLYVINIGHYDITSSSGSHGSGSSGSSTTGTMSSSTSSTGSAIVSGVTVVSENSTAVESISVSENQLISNFSTSSSSGSHITETASISTTSSEGLLEEATKPSTVTDTVNCFSFYSNCRNYDICYNDQSGAKRYLCLQAYLECSNGSQRQSLCGVSNLYDPVKNECIRRLCPLVVVTLLTHGGASGSTSVQITDIGSEVTGTGPIGDSSTSGSEGTIDSASGSHISTESGSEVIASGVTSGSGISSSSTTGSVSTSETVTQSKECFSSYSHCRTYEFCTANRDRGKRYLCASAFSECQGNGFRTRLCLKNHLYDPSSNECITNLCPLQIISTGHYSITSEGDGHVSSVSGSVTTGTVTVTSITEGGVSSSGSAVTSGSTTVSESSSVAESTSVSGSHSISNTSTSVTSGSLVAGAESLPGIGDPKPSNVTVTVNCFSSYSRCRNYDICYKDQSTDKRYLCLQAYSECSSGLQKKSLCPAGNLYDPVKNECVQKRCPLIVATLLIHGGVSGSTSIESSSGASSTVSESGVTGEGVTDSSSSASTGSGSAIDNASGSHISTDSSGTSSSSSTGSIPTSVTSTQSKECFSSYSRCKTYEFCTVNSERGTRYLCSTAYSECQGVDFRTRLCLVSHLYDPSRNECITNLCPLHTVSTGHYSITSSDGHGLGSSGSSSSGSISSSVSTSISEIGGLTSGSAGGSGTTVSESTTVTGSTSVSGIDSFSNTSTSTSSISHVTGSKPIVDEGEKKPSTTNVNCFLHYSQCRKYDICYNDQSNEKRYLCIQAYSECSNGLQRKMLCSVGNLYDPLKNKCVQQLCPFLVVSLLIHDGESESPTTESLNITSSTGTSSGTAGASVSEESSSASSGFGTATDSATGSHVSTSSEEEKIISGITSNSSTSSSSTAGSGSTSEITTQTKECFSSYSQCRTYEFCTANRDRGKRYLCASAFSECQGDGFRTRLCLKNHLYDPSSNECITNLCPLQTVNTGHYSMTSEGGDHIISSSGSATTGTISNSLGTSTTEIGESSSGSSIASGSTIVSENSTVAESTSPSGSSLVSNISSSISPVSHITGVESALGGGASEGDVKPSIVNVIVNCFSYYSQCRKYDICYNDQSTEKRYLCIQAYSECSNSLQRKLLCSVGYLYDPLKKECVQHLCPLTVVSLLIQEDESGSTSVESPSGTVVTASSLGSTETVSGGSSSVASGMGTTTHGVAESHISISSGTEVIASGVTSISGITSSSTTGSISTSETSTQSKECFPSYSKCRFYAFCTADNEIRRRYLCVSAYSDCQGDSFRTRLCLVSHLYDPSKNECITNLCPFETTSSGHYSTTVDGGGGHVSSSSGSSVTEAISSSASTSTTEIGGSSTGSAAVSGSTDASGSAAINSTSVSSGGGVVSVTSSSNESTIQVSETASVSSSEEDVSDEDKKPSAVIGTTNCFTSYSQCRKYDICYDSLSKAKRYLCLQAYSECSNGLQRKILCSSGNLYDPVKNTCVQQLCPLIVVSVLIHVDSSGSTTAESSSGTISSVSESGVTGVSVTEESSSASSDAGSTIDSVSGSHISTSSGTEVVSSGTSSSSPTGSISTSVISTQSKECFSSYSRCRSYEFCTGNGERGTRYLCATAYSECQGNGVRTRLCLVSHLYDPSRNECITNLCPLHTVSIGHYSISSTGGSQGSSFAGSSISGTVSSSTATPITQLGGSSTGSTTVSGSISDTVSDGGLISNTSTSSSGSYVTGTVLPSTINDTSKCFSSYSQCRNYDICYNDHSIKKRYLCVQAYSECAIGLHKKTLCSTGNLYDPVKNECVRQLCPLIVVLLHIHGDASGSTSVESSHGTSSTISVSGATGSDVTGESSTDSSSSGSSIGSVSGSHISASSGSITSSSGTSSSSTTGSVSTSETNVQSKECFSSHSQCRTYQFCTAKRERGTRYLCATAYSECQGGGFRTRLCLVSHLYDPSRNECITNLCPLHSTDTGHYSLSSSSDGHTSGSSGVSTTGTESSVASIISISNTSSTSSESVISNGGFENDPFINGSVSVTPNSNFSFPSSFVDQHSCFVSYSFCQIYDVCYLSNIKDKRLLCREATSSCSEKGIKKNLCSEKNSLYDPNTKECVTNICPYSSFPIANEIGDLSSNSSAYPLHSGPPIFNYTEFIHCQLKYSYCKSFHIEEENAKGKLDVLCVCSDICHFRGQKIMKTFVCNLPFINFRPGNCSYSLGSEHCKICIIEPSTRDEGKSVMRLQTSLIPEKKTQGIAMSSHFDVASSPSFRDASHYCSYTQEKLKTFWITHNMCSDVAICITTSNIEVWRVKSLCSNYVECLKDEESWKLQMSSCPEHQIYSYEEEKCIENYLDENCFLFNGGEPSLSLIRLLDEHLPVSGKRFINRKISALLNI